MPCPSSSETSADIKVNGEEQSTKKVSKGQRRIAEVDEVALADSGVFAFFLTLAQSSRVSHRDDSAIGSWQLAIQSASMYVYEGHVDREQQSHLPIRSIYYLRL